MRRDKQSAEMESKGGENRGEIVEDEGADEEDEGRESRHGHYLRVDPTTAARVRRRRLYALQHLGQLGITEDRKAKAVS